MSIFWIIYLITTAIVGCSLACIAYADRHELERLEWIHVLCCFVITLVPLLNIVVLVVATSHLVLHTLKRRDEARLSNPRYARTVPDTMSMMSLYGCECMDAKGDLR